MLNSAAKSTAFSSEFWKVWFMSENWLVAKIKDLRLLALLLLTGILIILWDISSYVAQSRIYNGSEPVGRIFLNETTGAITFIFCILPLLVVFLYRFVICRKNWFWSVPLHISVFLILGLFHTTLMTLSRNWLYPVFHCGEYEPGRLFYRYIMELRLEVLLYMLVTAIIYMANGIHAVHAREREAAAMALRSSQLQTQLSEVRLKALQGQLQPHFLFNTLNMISSYMYEDVRKADRMIARLSTLLRISLETSDQPCVPLHREMEILGIYLEIMEARFGARLRFTREMDPGLSEAPVPVLLLQPLVENAIRHGEPDPENEVVILVRAERKGKNLLLTVVDNGPGINSSGSCTEGTGLRTIRDRLAQLYGADARLEFGNSSPQGLLVSIELPMEPSKDFFCKEGPPQENASSL
jgi:signal transduction histidine kinase